MAEKYLAEYLRLSIEDGDVISGDSKTESDSIHHQRELITRYRSERKLYPELQTMEFVDDGYSGTNFERPAVKQMLTLIREGKICCVIVKDISRFGRSYLEVGDYLEQIFPFMGVRFIAINDGYDSDDYLGTTGGIEIAFKSLLYDLYSKDLSVKMYSTLQIQRNRGDFIGPRPPFGYQFSEDRKVLAVDHVAAQYVKRVFELACMGYSTGKIAGILNAEGIPTPGEYKNQNKMQYHIMNGKGYWNTKNVLRILENKVYLGIVVNGKSRVTKVGGKQFRRVPDEEQICIADRHEAIITEQVFLKASKVIRYNGCQRGKTHKSRQQSVLLGKLQCISCNRRLIRIDCTTIPYFTCKTVKFDKNRKCFDGKLLEPDVDAYVLKCVIEKIQQELPEKNKHTSMEKTLSTKNEEKKAKHRIEALKTEKKILYEQLKKEQIDRKNYLEKIEKLRSEETQLNKQIRQMQKRDDSSEERMEREILSGEVIELTRDIVDQYIDTIYVYGENQLEIVWKNNK